MIIKMYPARSKLESSVTDWFNSTSTDIIKNVSTQRKWMVAVIKFFQLLKQSAASVRKTSFFFLLR